MRSIQRHYAIAGIRPSKHSTNAELVNKKIFVGFLLYGYPSVQQHRTWIWNPDSSLSHQIYWCTGKYLLVMFANWVCWLSTYVHYYSSQALTHFNILWNFRTSNWHLEIFQIIFFQCVYQWRIIIPAHRGPQKFRKKKKSNNLQTFSRKIFLLERVWTFLLHQINLS